MRTILVLFLSLFICKQNIHCQQSPITIKTEAQSDNSIDVTYIKNAFGTFTLTIKFDNANNFSDPNFEEAVYMNSGTLLKIKPTDPNRGINFSMRTDIIRGVLNPRINPDFVYLLPFKANSKLIATEMSYLGAQYFGSLPPKNWKSINFQTDSALSILACRKGQIVEIVNSFDNESAEKILYTSKRNYLIIEQPDGSFAQYTGFKKNSFKVKEGDFVLPHTELGILEKKGVDSKPQLDFGIYFVNDKDYHQFRKKNEPNSLLGQRSVHEYVNPTFLTNNSLHKIKSGSEYIVVSDTEIIKKEMTKRERKIYENQ